jgi:Domain of unknown function (DUF4386)
MSTASTTSSFADRAAPAATLAAPSRRAPVVAAVLVVAVLIAAVNLLARPLAATDVDRYASLAPARDAVWTFSLVAGFATGVAYIAVGLAVCMLVQRRGAAWATAGALLTALGGILFCAGFFAWGAVSWYATSDAVPADASRAVFAVVQAEDGRAFGPQIAGFGLTVLGIVALAVALWRSRSAPRWLAVAVPLTLFAAIFSGTGVAYDVLFSLFMATLGGVAWCLWRTAGSDPRITSPL